MTEKKLTALRFVYWGKGEHVKYIHNVREYSMENVLTKKKQVPTSMMVGELQFVISDLKRGEEVVSVEIEPVYEK